MIIKLLRKLLRYLVKRKKRKERIAYVRANPDKWIAGDLYNKYKQIDIDIDKNLLIIKTLYLTTLLSKLESLSVIGLRE